MAKKFKQPVKKLTKYAENFGKWLAKHEEENGKVLTKNLSLEERGYKREHEHYVQDTSFNLDLALNGKGTATKPGSQVQVVKKVGVDQAKYQKLADQVEQLQQQNQQNSEKAKICDNIRTAYADLTRKWQDNPGKKWQLDAVKTLMEKSGNPFDQQQ